MIWIFAEVQAGDTIADGITALVETATRLGVGIQTEINGVGLAVVPGDHVETLLECWNLVAEGGHGTQVSTTVFKKAAS